MMSMDSRGIDASAVMRMATAYLARYSTSSARLRILLDRKIRRRALRQNTPLPEEAEIEAMLDQTMTRLTAAGFLDDTAFMLARARRLVGKGLPASRIRHELAHIGLDGRHEALDDTLVDDEQTQALRFAGRKRIGPFRTGVRTPFRDKDVRALIRAGFSPRVAFAVVDQGSKDEETSDRAADPTFDG